MVGISPRQDFEVDSRNDIEYFFNRHFECGIFEPTYEKSQLFFNCHFELAHKDILTRNLITIWRDKIMCKMVLKKARTNLAQFVGGKGGI